jgi:hypothetical protein
MRPCGRVMPSIYTVHLYWGCGQSRRKGFEKPRTPDSLKGLSLSEANRTTAWPLTRHQGVVGLERLVPQLERPSDHSRFYNQVGCYNCEQRATIVIALFPVSTQTITIQSVRHAPLRSDRSYRVDTVRENTSSSKKRVNSPDLELGALHKLAILVWNTHHKFGARSTVFRASRRPTFVNKVDGSDGIAGSAYEDLEGISGSLLQSRSGWIGIRRGVSSFLDSNEVPAAAIRSGSLGVRPKR